MRDRNRKKIVIKKINEDDILEIILEHFQDDELKEGVITKGVILGVPGKDLRFVGAFGDETSEEIYKYDLENIDKNQGFNGSHAFLENNPDFHL